MNFMKVTLAMLLCLVLASCGTFETKTTPVVQNFDAPKLDPSLLVKCDPLTIPSVGVFSLGDLTAAYTDLQGQYTECAVRQACLVGASADPKKASMRCSALDEFLHKKGSISNAGQQTVKKTAIVN